MKRYVLSVAAALAVALAATGGALAGPGPAAATAHPPRRAHPRTWLEALIRFPHKPAPPHRAKPKPAPKAKPARRRRRRSAAAPPAAAEDDDALALRAQRAATGPRRPGLLRCSSSRDRRRGPRLRQAGLLPPGATGRSSSRAASRRTTRSRSRWSATRTATSRACRDGSHRVDRARARHEQLPPVACRAPTSRACAGRARRTGSSSAARPEGAGGPRRGRPPRTTPSPPGTGLQPDAAVLPRLPRGRPRPHALRLRLARRRRRRDLERTAGVVRRRRAPEHEGSAGDLQLRDGARVGGAGADRPRSVRPRRSLRGRHDAGDSELRLRAPAARRRTTPSSTRSARKGSAMFRCRTAARTSSVRGGSESAPVSAGADLTRSGSGARVRRRSWRCRRRPSRPARPAASARSRAARRARRGR